MHSDSVVQQLVRLNGAVIGVWDREGRYHPRTGAERPYDIEQTRRRLATERFWNQSRKVSDLLMTKRHPERVARNLMDRLINPAVLIRSDGTMEPFL